MMESLRIEMQKDIASRVTPLENQCNELKQKQDVLQQRYDALEHEYSELKKRCTFLEKQQADDVAKTSSINNAFLQMDRKVKFLEVMHRNNDYTHPLTVPSIDYLLENGRFGDEAQEIREYAFFMSNVTYKVKRNTLFSKHHVEIRPPRGWNNFSYYHEMSPFWDEFIDALVEFQYTIDYFENEKFTFSVSNVELPREVLNKLSGAFQLTRFRNLVFIKTRYEDDGDCLDFAVNCITTNPRLEHFCWGNTITNASDVSALYNAINMHESLNSIDLCWCENNDDKPLHGVFNGLKSKTLQKINLYSNKISNLVGTDIMEFFSSNMSLKELDLSQNELTDNDIAWIAHALTSNTRLRKLVIDSLSPGNEIRPGMIYAIYNVSTFNALWHSNHHCQVILYRSAQTDFDDVVKSFLENLNIADPQSNRMRKIYSLLLGKNSLQQNVSQFHSEGIDAKHLPYILSLLKPYSEQYCRSLGCTEEQLGTMDTKSLSITYEIVRGYAQFLVNSSTQLLI